jgi:hypothetical protein
MVKIAPAHKNHTVRANNGAGVKAQAFRTLDNNRNAIPMSVSRSHDRRALSKASNRIGVSPYIYLRKKTVSSSETSFCFLKQSATDKFQQLGVDQTEQRCQDYTLALSTTGNRALAIITEEARCDGANTPLSFLQRMKSLAAKFAVHQTSVSSVTILNTRNVLFVNIRARRGKG